MGIYVGYMDMREGLEVFPYMKKQNLNTGKTVQKIQNYIFNSNSQMSYVYRPMILRLREYQEIVLKCP